MDIKSFVLGQASASGGGDITVESLSATENKTYTAPTGKAYSPVVVNVPGPTLQTKSATPTTSAQDVEPDSGYDGLSKVTVGAIPSQYIVPAGKKTITENGTDIDVSQFATADVAVSSGGSVKMGALRPDAELWKSWSYDKLIVEDEEVTIPAYTTTATTLKASATLEEVTIDPTEYNYLLVQRGLSYPIYSVETTGKGRFEVFNVVRSTEVMNIPAGWVFGEGSQFVSVLSASNFYRSIFWNGATTRAVGNLETGIPMSFVDPVYASSGNKLTVKSPNLKIKGDSSYFSNTFWDYVTDIRYQYIVELYRVPVTAAVDGWSYTSLFQHVVDCMNNNNRKLT